MRLADLRRINAAKAAREAVAAVTDLRAGTVRVVEAGTYAADPLADVIGECLRLRQSRPARHEGRDFFITVHMPPIRLLLVGAVHISQALAPMAAGVGLDVTVLDPRTAFATAERFPGVALMAQWPDDVLCRYGIDAYTAVALLTHDPRIDDQVLRAALRSPCFYIGALGSRKTQASRRARMVAEGFDEHDLGRIHGPIGLDIGAVSPAEIAVSILAEVVGAMRRRPAGNARDAA